MRSRWDDAEARAAVERWGAFYGADVALRVYSSRLVGADPGLVLHGGGNTSVKAPFRSILGESLDALYVKGSGTPLDRVGPRDLPALELAPLRELRRLESLTDEEMRNQLAIRRFEASGPSPSVETLLHAFLPHRFVDHSHADAILVLTNQPEAEALVHEALGDRVVVLPYIMPGFPLAKAVAEAVEKRPEVEGAVLLKHGLFTFAEDARTSYERHVALVEACERFAAERTRGRAILTPAYRAPAPPEVLAVHAAPLVRGLVAEPGSDSDPSWRRGVLDWRAGPSVLAFCASEQARRLAATGPLTPDHVIRTKALPLFVPDPAWDDLERLRAQLANAAARYRAEYEAYFARHASQRATPPIRLDSAPRVVLLPGAGAFCFGRTARDAAIAADITEHTLAAKPLAEALGRYEALLERDLFDMEYWVLEQAKLGRRVDRALEGQVVLVTGAAGAMGAGIAAECARAGAHVVLSDVDAGAAERLAAMLVERHGPGAARSVALDVTDPASVRRGFDAACLAYGGIDVVVANAGMALVAPVEELDPDALRRVTDVNFVGVALTIREAARVLRAQGTGGHVIVNSTKNVFAPGRAFGAYSASKAAAHQLAKVAALELAPLGVRVNLLAPDAVFDAEGVRSGLWKTVGAERARALGLTLEELPEHYRRRNLLQVRVTAQHVGRAVVFFASDATPTTGATLPIDGGLPEAFPR